MVLEDTKEIEDHLLSITRAFLKELGRERAIRALTMDALFERDLGIDSLGRVELFHRIEEGFNITLPESLMASAIKLSDLLGDIKEAKPSVVTFKQSKALELQKTDFSPGQSTTLVEILIEMAKKEPTRPHIYFQDEKGQEITITYGQLYQNALNVAANLQAYDIEPGDTISIMLPTSENFFYIFFGILLAGAIPVPIYPPFRPERIEEYAMREANILRNAQARLLITFHEAQRLSELLQVFISSLKAVVTADSLMKPNSHYKKVTVTANMPALIQYTSGSTSLPKGVLLSHANVLANIRAAGQSIQVGPSDVGISWLPLYHDMGLIGAWFICFYHAIPVVIMSPLTFLTRPERWLWAVHYHRGTISAAPNFAYELCIRRIKPESIQGLDLSSWRLSLNGAEAVNPNTIQKFIDKFSPYGYKPQTMFPVYGLAESTVALCFPPLNRAPIIDRINRNKFETELMAIPALANETKALEFVCCGSAIVGHEIKVVDAQGEVVPERKIGFIYFRGPSSMQGYYQQPEITKAITHDGWLDSGDMGYFANGELYITGRKKDTIIKAGRNLYPEEIEEVTSQVTGVRKGCVVAFGVEDKRQGTEKLIVVVETGEQNDNLRKKMSHEINEKLAVVLGFVPDEVLLVAPKTVPKTSSGKLQRSACKQAYLDKKLQKKGLPVWMQISKLFIRGAWTKVAKGFIKVFKILYSFYVAILIAMFGLSIVMGVLILPYKAAARTTKWLSRFGLALMGCPLKVNNRHHLLQSSSMIYIANHASYLDAVVLIALLPPGVQFVAKKELLKVPLLSTIIKKLNMITVDRVDFMANLSDTDIIGHRLKAGNSIGIFPEGTFSYATGLRPFKMGAFKLAVESLTSICPIAIKGTRSILRDDEFIFSPGKIEVSIGEDLIPQSTDWQEAIRLHHLAREFIAQHCGEPVIDY